MKSIFKGEWNKVLMLLLLTLLFILWSRVIVFEIKQGAKTHNIDTVLKRVECAASFGWQVDPGSEKCERIKIPEYFGATYEKYNEIQNGCGFDLNPYKGKMVFKYSYIVLNPPEISSETFYVNILVCEDCMIGGDVETDKLDGIILPVIRGKDA